MTLSLIRCKHLKPLVLLDKLGRPWACHLASVSLFKALIDLACVLVRMGKVQVWFLERPPKIKEVDSLVRNAPWE